MRIFLITFSVLLFACSDDTAREAEQETEAQRLVLTSLAPVYQLSSSLLDGTDIEIMNIPAQARSMASQPTFFARQHENFSEQFQTADAVINIAKLWPQDPLYVAAREHNIRIVQIDASQPWSRELSGVGIRTLSDGETVNPYYWLSLSNMVRSLNIIADDLQSLYPDQAEIIEANLNSEVNAIVQMRTSFELALLDVLDPVVYALSDEFNYLTNDLGIFVDAYFVKQDIDWTDADLQNLTRHLQDNNIPVVIHKWEPTDEISEAITEGGAILVVLDRMEVSDQPLTDLMQENLQSLLEALLQTE